MGSRLESRLEQEMGKGNRGRSDGVRSCKDAGGVAPRQMCRSKLLSRVLESYRVAATGFYSSGHLSRELHETIHNNLHGPEVQGVDEWKKNVT